MSKSSRKNEDPRRKGRSDGRGDERSGKTHKGQPSGSMDERFYECLTCGAIVDSRNLDDVLYHEDPRHRPDTARSADESAPSQE
jgi:hypothetical protein